MHADGTDPGDPGGAEEDPFERLLREAAAAEDLVTDGRAVGVFALARESVREAMERGGAPESHAERLRRAEVRAEEWALRREMRAEERERVAEERAAARSRRLQCSAVVALCAVGVLGLGAVVAGTASLAADRGGGATDGRAQGGSEAAAPAQRDEPETDPETEEASGPDAERKAEMLQVDPVWASDVAARSGIPERALRAYAGAALTLAEEEPGCGLGWNTLAAIGFVETGHGTIHGAQIDGDGRVLPRIYGVPLDGTEFAAIPDTDGGRLDGDAVWDRAVGPMQFIPQTWEEYGRDADGDGEIDVDHIDDAALSAASLLCSTGGDLRVADDWIAAVEAYNPSVAYNNDVVEAADHYARFG